MGGTPQTKTDPQSEQWGSGSNEHAPTTQNPPPTEGGGGDARGPRNTHWREHQDTETGRGCTPWTTPRRPPHHGSRSSSKSSSPPAPEGNPTAEDVRALHSIGIDILDRTHGLAAHPATASSHHDIKADTALHALTRWAHPPTPPTPPTRARALTTTHKGDHTPPPHPHPTHPDPPHPGAGGRGTPGARAGERGHAPWHSPTETHEHQQANGNEHAKPQHANSTIHANTPTADHAPAPSNSTTGHPTKKAAATTSRTSNGSANATTQ